MDFRLDTAMITIGIQTCDGYEKHYRELYPIYMYPHWPSLVVEWERAFHIFYMVSWLLSAAKSVSGERNAALVHNYQAAVQSSSAPTELSIKTPTQPWRLRANSRPFVVVPSGSNRQPSLDGPTPGLQPGEWRG